MTEIRNSNAVWVIGSWILEFICNLVLEIWDCGFEIDEVPAVRFKILCLFFLTPEI
jgi:hypothetical protein